MLAAAYNPNPEAITILVKSGADVNNKWLSNGYTALIDAAAHTENPEVIATLLNLGADPKIENNEKLKAIDFAKNNKTLKNTDVLRKLHELSN